MIYFPFFRQKKVLRGRIDSLVTTIQPISSFLLTSGNRLDWTVLLPFRKQCGRIRNMCHEQRHCCSCTFVLLSCRIMQRSESASAPSAPDDLSHRAELLLELSCPSWRSDQGDQGFSALCQRQSISQWQIDWLLVFNAQSTMTVISGRQSVAEKLKQVGQVI